MFHFSRCLEPALSVAGQTLLVLIRQRQALLLTWHPMVEQGGRELGEKLHQ